MNFFLQYGYISTLLTFKADAQYQKKFRFDEILDEVLSKTDNNIARLQICFPLLAECEIKA